MARKEVKVRLSPEGGDRTKRELREVGDTGDRAFGKVRREIDMVNARLERFGRRVRVAMAAASAAATAAGVALVRSSLQQVDAQAKLARSLDTTVASVQVLERTAELAGVSFSAASEGASRLTRRLSLAAQGTGPAVTAFERLQLNLEDLAALPLDQRLIVINNAVQDLIPEIERAGVLSQIFGDRAFAAFARLDNATIAQATEDLRAFGVVVSDQDAAQIERTNDAVTRLGLIWTGLGNRLAVAVAPAIEATVDAIAAITRIDGPVAQTLGSLFENFDRLAAIAGTFAAIMAGRWVASLGAALVSVRGLATALVVLRGALIRTGVFALVVGAGELVFQFGRLVEAAGGFGNAMALLQDVALEVWDRIAQGGTGLVAIFRSAADGIRAAFLGSFASIIEGFATMTQAIADGYNRLLGSLGLEANAEGIGQGLADAIRGAQETLRTAAGTEFDRGMFLLTDAQRPLASLDAIREAMAAVEDGSSNAAEAVGRVNDALAELEAPVAASAGARGGGAQGAVESIGRVNDALRETQRRTDQVRATFSETFASILTGASSASDALSRLLSGFANQLAQSAFNSLLGPLFNFALPSFDGGGRTPSGPRSGGIDGRGGFLSILHPDEEVRDLTRSSGQSEMGVNVYISLDGARGDRELEEIAYGASARAFEAFSTQQLPIRVQRVNESPRRRG